MNYTNHSLIVISRITGCISISDFASLVGVPIEIAISPKEFKIYVVTVGIKNQSIINKKKTSHDKVLFLVKI